ncbi:multiple epidermal growth factor-like domains protein 9 [Brachyhypopomus gauderio]|uniref:multiple epidermal growth factor-like domains protein 9 n=1 Tax=Brachyhypopomus gauderio TaxID=698409 RepID=UPI0040411A24
MIMWWIVLMMFTSSAFPFIVSVCVGLSEAAPGVNSHDAVPVPREPRGIAAESSWYLNVTRVGVVALPGLSPAPPIAPTSPDPPPAEPTTPPGEPVDAAFSRRRAGATASAQSKRLQTTVSDKVQKAGVMPEVITTSDGSQELVCNCSTEGVLDPDDCDRDTGQCVCMGGYAGLQCEECEEDHYTNGTIGCQPCACDSFGSVSPRCDSSGTCECKTGVYGPKCDDCHPGFFHFSNTGCQPCQCNGHTTYCHPQSGVCLDCQGNTQGQNCEDCLPQFYRAQGSSVRDSCVPCPCARNRSSGTCHLDPSGRPVCDECRSGFTGPVCDVCAGGYSASGDVCVPCNCHGNEDPRSAPQICHPESGHCLHCANHTAGTHCQLCALGYVGDARAHNCTPTEGKLLPTPVTGKPRPTAPQSHAPSPPGLPPLLLFTSTPAPPPGAEGAPTLRSGLGDPAARGNSSASALTAVSWTQFNIIVLAVIIVLVVLLMAFVGGVYTYREYHNRKLNAPFWTIELKEDNISFSSYHDSLPHPDPSALLEEEPCVVAANGQLALATAANMYKA